MGTVRSEGQLAIIALGSGMAVLLVRALGVPMWAHGHARLREGAGTG